MANFLSKTHRAHSIFKRGGSLKGRVVVAVAVAAIAIAIVVSAIDLSGGARAGRPATGTLYFGAETAKLVGGTVLVPVKCVGVKGAECSGELSLKGDGASSKAPFTVTSGGNRTVSIPAGGASSGASVVATAKTDQPSGSYATSSEVLHLR